MEYGLLGNQCVRKLLFIARSDGSVTAILTGSWLAKVRDSIRVKVAVGVISRR